MKKIRKSVEELKTQELVVNNNGTMSSIDIAKVTGKFLYEIIPD